MLSADPDAMERAARHVTRVATAAESMRAELATHVADPGPPPAAALVADAHAAVLDTLDALTAQAREDAGLLSRAAAILREADGEARRRLDEAGP